MDYYDHLGLPYYLGRTDWRDRLFLMLLLWLIYGYDDVHYVVSARYTSFEE